MKGNTYTRVGLAITKIELIQKYKSLKIRDASSGDGQQDSQKTISVPMEFTFLQVRSPPITRGSSLLTLLSRGCWIICKNLDFCKVWETTCQTTCSYLWLKEHSIFLQPQKYSSSAIPKTTKISVKMRRVVNTPVELTSFLKFDINFALKCMKRKRQFQSAATEHKVKVTQSFSVPSINTAL